MNNRGTSVTWKKGKTRQPWDRVRKMLEGHLGKPGLFAPSAFHCQALFHACRCLGWPWAEAPRSGSSSSVPDSSPSSLPASHFLTHLPPSCVPHFSTCFCLRARDSPKCIHARMLGTESGVSSSDTSTSHGSRVRE